MRRTQTAGLALIVAALVLAAGWIASGNGASAGAGPTVAVDSATIAVGENGTVSVRALNMAAPGLGAWSLNVVYDPAVLQQQGCTAQNGSVCNPTFAADTVRISGAQASGMPGDTVLATIGFRCISTGSSALSITIDTLADGTPGNPQDIDAAVDNGSITCTVPSTPTEPPPPPPAAGGNGFPAAGGTYIGDVPGEGRVTLVISPDGQGISSITVTHLVTVCGTINQALSFDPPLDIQEPGFSYALFTFSEGGAVLSMDGFFAENGTIPVNLRIDTSNEDFPGGASPCLSENQVIPLVLVRTQVAPPPPPSGGSYSPPPSGGSYTSGGGLPNAGSGGFTLDPQSPMTWIVAAMAGAGLAWLSAGVAGAGLAAATSSAGEQRQRTIRGFMPRMRPVRHNAQSAQPMAVDHSARTSRRETPAVERPLAPRTTPKIDTSSVSEFHAPKRPDRR